MSELLLLPITAFLVCAGLHIAACKLFPRWGLLDFPERYGLTRPKIPYPTGILAIVVFLGFFLYLEPTTKQTLGLTAGIALLGTTTFLDDRKQLSPVVRLAVQLIVAMLIFGLGTRIYTITNPLGGILKLDSMIIPFALFSDPPVLSGIFTIAWLILTTNALNWFDGIPGQVSSISCIGFLTLGLLSLSSRVDQPNLAILCFILAACAGACLLFDFPPNKVLMGDTGAMFFGLMLGVITIYAGGKVATAFLVLGVPLIDSGIVVIRRLAKGVSPARGNTRDEHLHHRLLNIGWTERQVIALTVVIGSAFGVSALFLSTFEKALAGIVLFLVMLLLSQYSRT